MNRNNLPDGWNDDRVRGAIAHYDAQREDEALAEDEAGARPKQTEIDINESNLPDKMSSPSESAGTSQRFPFGFLREVVGDIPDPLLFDAEEEDFADFGSL